MEQINKLQKEIDELRKILQEKENEMYRIKKEWATRSIPPQVRGGGQENNKCSSFCGDVLPKWAIERYSRQILLPDIGVSGQQKMCAARVLIVGAGGLGCPAALYLAGAGVGELGIVDYDSVEVTNIHRQVLHTEADQMLSKAESAANTLRSINSRIKVTAFTTQLDSSNALSILNKYDLVLDCTDNLPTRYLLSDAAVMTQIPLISGSALKMEGQLTVYGYRGPKTSDDKGDVSPAYSGSCYRCIFPTPAPADTVQSCSSAGVAGPVTGVIGALQALEAIKYLSGHHHSKLLVDRMLLFDGEDCTFRTVRLRSRNPNCPVCSSDPSITALTDYEMFCNAQAKEKDLDLQILPPEHRITALELSSKLGSDTNHAQRHLLVDVRNEAEFQMCRIDGSVNYPIESLRGEVMEGLVKRVQESEEVTFICRRGNDSQLVAAQVLNILQQEQKSRVRDLTGGLHAWAKYVDNEFPVY